MSNYLQKKAFVDHEADGWFERNLRTIQGYKKEDDAIVRLIQEYHLQPENILEIGCSAGYRLNGLKETFPDSKVYGIEPSVKAVDFSKTHFPLVEVQNGTADDLGFFKEDSMDIVIVGFVFYVIDRKILFKTISEIDRVLKNAGILIILDFFAPFPSKNKYDHIKEFSAFSFKQNYCDIFTSSNLYTILSKNTFTHTTRSLSADDDFYDKYSIVMLKKEIDASYK